jgi:hypothetical protein
MVAINKNGAANKQGKSQSLHQFQSGVRTTCVLRGRRMSLIRHSLERQEPFTLRKYGIWEDPKL